MFIKGHKIRNTGSVANSGVAMKTLTKTTLKHRKYLEGAKQAIKSKGRDLYLLYMDKNVLLSPKQAITAQCAHCSGWYADGKCDCENADCPLYPYMPYGQHRKVRVQGKQ